MENFLLYKDSIIKYSICIIVSVFLARTYDYIKIRKRIRFKVLYFFIIATPFSILIGLRNENTGFDTDNYVRWIENLDLVANREIIFRYILSILEPYVEKFGYSLVFIIFAYLTLLLYIWAIDLLGKETSVSLGLFMYLTYFGLRMGDGMRQLVAMSVFAIAYVLLVKRQYLFSTIMWVIAIGIHTSVLFAFFLVIFVKYTKLGMESKYKICEITYKSKIRLILLLALGCLGIVVGFQFIMMLLSKIMISRYQFYFTSQVRYQRIGFGIVYEMCPIIILGIFFRNKLKKPNDNEWFAYAFLAIIFRLVGYYSYFVARMSYFSILIGLILIAKNISMYKGQNRVYITVIVGLVFVMFFVIYYVILLGHGMIPYKSIYD